MYARCCNVSDLCDDRKKKYTFENQGFTKEQTVVNTYHKALFYRPLFLEPEVSPFRTSGSQSRQYHVRDCGSSVKPTQSR